MEEQFSMLSHEIAVDHDRRFVRITVEGEISQEGGEDIITSARTTASEHGYGALYDVHSATPMVQLASFFFLPRELGVLKEATTRHIRVAILVAEDANTDAYRFYEIAAKNVGLAVRIFLNEDDAIAWLREG